MTLNEVRRPVSEVLGVWEEKKKSKTFPSAHKKEVRHVAEWNLNGL